MTTWVLSSGLELPTPDAPILVSKEAIESGNIESGSLRKARPPSDVAKRANNTYRWAWSNAVGLLDDAQILVDGGRHARAFALAATALEEIGKSQYAADVYTGFLPYESFDAHIRNHTFKSAYAARAVDFVGIKPALIQGLGEALFARRNQALYASPAGEVVDDEFAHDAGVMIDYSRTWLTNIRQQEYIAERIGTRAFLK